MTISRHGRTYSRVGCSMCKSDQGNRGGSEGTKGQDIAGYCVGP